MTDITNQQLLDALTKQMATKADLKNELTRFATKDDLRQELTRFATKADLKAFATKDDLKQELTRFATKDDLKDGLEELKDDLVYELTDQLGTMSDNMATNQDVEKLGQRLGVQQEQMQRSIDTALELLGADIVAKSTLKNHGERLDAIETENISIKDTLKRHSHQLKT